VGGALGVALLGQIFFSAVSADLASGTAPHTAYVAAIGDALYYDLGAFILMVLMAPFIRAPRDARLAPARDKARRVASRTAARKGTA
jgi:hypothetical protein